VPRILRIPSPELAPSNGPRTKNESPTITPKILITLFVTFCSINGLCITLHIWGAGLLAKLAKNEPSQRVGVPMSGANEHNVFVRHLLRDPLFLAVQVED
jgi:hypothetical protein